MVSDTDKMRRLAADTISEAWNDALSQGVQPDLLASTALSVALSTLVRLHGHDTAARMIDRFADAIREGKFDHMAHPES